MKTSLPFLRLLVFSLFILLSCDSSVTEKQISLISEITEVDSIKNNPIDTIQEVVYSAPEREVNQEEYDQLVDLEMRLVWLFKQKRDLQYKSYSGDEDEVFNTLTKMRKQIYALMMEALSINESFYYPFDSLCENGFWRSVTKDNRIRAYCWHVLSLPKDDFYNSFLQYHDLGGDVKLQVVDAYKIHQGGGMLMDIYSLESGSNNYYLAILQNRYEGGRTQSAQLYEFKNDYLVLVPNRFPEDIFLYKYSTPNEFTGFYEENNGWRFSVTMEEWLQRSQWIEMEYNDSLRILSHVNFSKIDRRKRRRSYHDSLRTPLHQKKQYKFENGKFRVLPRD
jgi:hypothetical protein